MQSKEGVREASKRGGVTVATVVGTALLYLADYYSTSCKRANYDTFDYHTVEPHQETFSNHKQHS